MEDKSEVEAVHERIDNLERVIADGFTKLNSILEGIITKLIIPATDKNYITMESHQKAIQIFKDLMIPIFKTLCWGFVVVLIWVTGLKSMFTPGTLHLP